MQKPKFLLFVSIKNHKKNCKPDSVNSPKRKCLLFICVLHCCKTLAVYPSVFGASHSYPGEPGKSDILNIAPQRVYLISL